MSKCKKVLGIALPIILLFVALVSVVSHAQMQPPTIFEIEGMMTVNVSDNGIAYVREEIKFSAQAFVVFKQVYNPISTFVRELRPRATPEQIENLSINLDEVNNKLTMTYTLLGAAVYKGNGLWELEIAEPGKRPNEKLTLTTQHGNTLVFTHVYGAGENYKIMETLTVNLPTKAENIKYDEDEGKISYKLNVSTGTSNGNMLYAGIALMIIGGVIVAVPNVKKRKNIVILKKHSDRQQNPPPVSSESE